MNNSINGWHKHPSSDRQLRFSKYGKQRAWDRDVHEDDGFHPIEEEADQLEFPFQSENSQLRTWMCTDLGRPCGHRKCCKIGEIAYMYSMSTIIYKENKIQVISTK